MNFWWSIGSLVGALLLLGGTFTWLEYGQCNHRCEAQRDRADAAEAALKSARQRSTDLALLWAKGIEQSGKAAEAQRRENQRTTDELNVRIARLSNRPACAVSGAARSVFDDITARANAGGAAPAASSAPTPQTVPGPAPAELVYLYSEQSILTFDNAAGDAYRDAVSQWQACVDGWQALSDKSRRVAP